ncbi:MAG: hypothetical protein GXO18_07605 [Aquificae bacterium]|nr:hypothetical protein [Aquificota bacterium]
MRRMVREVFLGVRFLVSLYFLLASLTMSAPQKSTLIMTTALYFSFALLIYLKYDRAKVVNGVVDLIFVPAMVLLSGKAQAVYALIPVIVMHTSRSVITGMLLTLVGLLLTVYYMSDSPMAMFSTLILMVASPVSAMIPDFLSIIKKERDSVKNLRSSYRKVLQDFARWERDRRELDTLRFLLEVSLSSQDVREFLKKVKEKFKVKRIHVIPKREIEDFSVLKDKDKGLLSVPVRLEEGNAIIIFEMESPFQLNDEVVVQALERAGKMVSLYVAGFENDSSVGKAINIS